MTLPYAVAVGIAVGATCAMLWWVSRRWRRTVVMDITITVAMYEPGDVVTFGFADDYWPRQATVTGVKDRQITVAGPVPWPRWWRLAVAMAPLTLLPLAGWLA